MEEITYKSKVKHIEMYIMANAVIVTEYAT